MIDSFSIPNNERRQWVTPIGGKLYPDYLDEAKIIYAPIVLRFGELLDQAKTSEDLLRSIAKEPDPKMAQLAKIFHLYVSPHTSVEMLRRRTKVMEIINNFADSFRPIDEVRRLFKSRPIDDEVLIARLYEYRDRGQRGYEVTRLFFEWFKNKFGSIFKIEGPYGAGPDIYLPSVLEGYPHNTPVDFIIRTPEGIPLVVGFARYDSDRGGAQEDDRTGGYGEKVIQIFQYAKSRRLSIKVLFVNDGPGLLLGSMWEDYAHLEKPHGGKVMVCTLKMLNYRLTEQWIRS